MTSIFIKVFIFNVNFDVIVFFHHNHSQYCIVLTVITAFSASIFAITYGNNTRIKAIIVISKAI